MLNANMVNVVVYALKYYSVQCYLQNKIFSYHQFYLCFTDLNKMFS